MDLLAVACLFFGSSAVVVTIRLTYVLLQIRHYRKVPFDNVSASKEIRTMVVVGSGRWPVTVTGDNRRELHRRAIWYSCRYQQNSLTY